MDEIAPLRKQIDELDNQIIEALAKRVQVAKKIGATKKKLGKPVRDTAREQEVYKQIKEKAAASGLDPNKVEALYREIIAMCSEIQQ